MLVVSAGACTLNRDTIHLHPDPPCLVCTLYALQVVSAATESRPTAAAGTPLPLPDHPDGTHLNVRHALYPSTNTFETVSVCWLVVQARGICTCHGGGGGGLLGFGANYPPPPLTVGRRPPQGGGGGSWRPRTRGVAPPPMAPTQRMATPSSGGLSLFPWGRACTVRTVTGDSHIAGLPATAMPRYCPRNLGSQGSSVDRSGRGAEECPAFQSFPTGRQQAAGHQSCALSRGPYLVARAQRCFLTRHFPVRHLWPRCSVSTDLPRGRPSQCSKPQCRT